MGLEAVDFPTDKYSYTSKLRKELTILYGQCIFSPDCIQAVRMTLEYFATKLPEAEKECAAYLKKYHAEHSAHVEPVVEPVVAAVEQPAAAVLKNSAVLSKPNARK